MSICSNDWFIVCTFTWSIYLTVFIDQVCFSLNAARKVQSKKLLLRTAAREAAESDAEQRHLNQTRQLCPVRLRLRRNASSTAALQSSLSHNALHDCRPFNWCVQVILADSETDEQVRQVCSGVYGSLGDFIKKKKERNVVSGPWVERVLSDGNLPAGKLASREDEEHLNAS